MSFRRTRTVNIEPFGTLDIVEMNGRAFIEWQELQQQGKTQIHIAAAIAAHCCPAFEDKTADELLDILTPGQLAELFTAIVEISELDKGKNSEAESRPVSSVS